MIRNLLIHGDNLLGLKALEKEYTGKIKCIYIDPPYNTRQKFSHYKDFMKSSEWLNMMKERLVIMHKLLREDGSIWISIDDRECHYLKVMCDKIFGRENFVANVIWQKKYTQANDARFFSDNHDHSLTYCKSIDKFSLNLLRRTDKQLSAYRNPDNDPRGAWKSTPLHAKSGTNSQPYRFKTGKVYTPPIGTFHRFSRKKLFDLELNNEIYFGKSGESIPSKKSFLSQVRQGIVPKTIWSYEEVGHNHEAREEAKLINPDDPFTNPKPERLLQRIIHLATDPGDIVLDSFAGSGTTGAVAHKMGRRWIMIEMENTVHSHIIPRMEKVISGEDQGGISKAVEWKGGGEIYEIKTV